MKYQKAWWKSKTLWFSFSVGVLGLAIEVFDGHAPGWLLEVIAAATALLRVLTDKPLSTGEVPYAGPREG